MSSGVREVLHRERLELRNIGAPFEDGSELLHDGWLEILDGIIEVCNRIDLQSDFEDLLRETSDFFGFIGETRENRDNERLQITSQVRVFVLNDVQHELIAYFETLKRQERRNEVDHRLESD